MIFEYQKKLLLTCQRLSATLEKSVKGEFHNTSVKSNSSSVQLADTEMKSNHIKAQT